MTRKWIRLTVFALALAVTAGALALGLRTRAASVSAGVFAENPNLDPGTALSGRAPGITLTDQFGHSVSLRSYRGRVVLLAFTDLRCTTICPLTTTEMLDAKRLMGAAGAHVALLGVDANPEARSIADVRAYSAAHGMMDQWRFLTGSLAQLRHVWSAYHIAVQIEAGQIDHTPALYVIDPQGRLAKLYLTEMAYAGIDQQAQILAREISSLLPGHPDVHSDLSYARIPTIDPGAGVTLPRAGGGAVSLGPHRARLVLFFATWDAETSNLGAGLETLGRYVAHAARAPTEHLPELVAIDQADVEPTPAALPRLLRTLPRPLPYPVAMDRTGRVAEGYGVEDQPWLVLVSSSGQILWHYDVSTSGWPTVTALTRDVQAALESPLSAAPSAARAARELAGSPPELAALHAQAGRLLSGASGTLGARLRALRGYPVVLNVWASWCTPCQKEFPLFAVAAARYGRRVAFLGADYEDSSGGARSFLAAHPVSYPTYEASSGQLDPLATITGVPTTIYIDPAGHVVHVHIGQYDAQGTLDQDIGDYTP